MPEVIDIPSYDHAEEMADLEANLARWHAQASRRPPYLAPSAYSSDCQLSERFSRGVTLTSNQSPASSPSELSQILPDELLLKISWHLQPSDLISFSRLKKSLRKRLMSRDSGAIWEAALSRMSGLPPCPSHMALPHYAALLFDDLCMGCGGVHGTKLAVALGWRLCETCAKRNFIAHGHVKSRFAQAIGSRALLRDRTIRQWSVRHLLPHCWLFLNHDPAELQSEGRTFYYYEPEVDLFLAEYLPLLLGLFSRGAAADDGLDLALQSRINFASQAEQLSLAVDAWYASQTLRIQILAVTQPIGFIAADFSQNLEEYDERLQQTTPLTEEIWEWFQWVLLPIVDENRQRRVWRSDSVTDTD
ncbi:hypothetical protein OH77DRAFT_1087626 [Trametes cingulata]|nr:hypothetical protein OH77DRAFT_1087626 [Trametes cingulata]